MRKLKIILNIIFTAQNKDDDAGTVKVNALLILF